MGGLFQLSSGQGLVGTVGTAAVFGREGRGRGEGTEAGHLGSERTNGDGSTRKSPGRDKTRHRAGQGRVPGQGRSGQMVYDAR